MQNGSSNGTREVLGFKIEAAIPIPPRPGRAGFGSEKKYPFDTLGVGESFFAASSSKNALAAQVVYWSKKLGWKFTRRSVDGGVRIWRVK